MKEEIAPSLESLIGRMRKPVQFACWGTFVPESPLDRFEEFMNQHVELALLRTQDHSIRRQLMALRQLFQDFGTLPIQDQKIRMVKAKRQLFVIDSMISVGPNPRSSHWKFSWSKPIQYIRGVGPKRASLFERLGVRTLEDLLFFFPWRYEDRRVISTASDLRPDQIHTIEGVIQSVNVLVTRKKKFRILQMMVGDASGSIVAKWFNQPYLEKVFQVGRRVIISGKVKIDSFRGHDFFVDNPVFELVEEGEEGNPASLHMGRIVPVYHETKGLNSRLIRSVIYRVLRDTDQGIEERIAPSILDQYGFPNLSESIQAIHFPKEGELSALAQARTPAQQRIIFDEFLLLQLGLAFRRQEKTAGSVAQVLSASGPVFKHFLKHLPFQLTHAQIRVIDEIQRDIARMEPMNRLLQGDVGSGKTIVAVAAIAMAVDSGFQSALMVPTEILAEQQYTTIKRLLEPYSVRCSLITQGSPGAERKAHEEDVAVGRASVVVGTHALVQQGVIFHRLGLVVIDEQHKFGVMQRASLARKGSAPHVLVMTATPIPRTLALSVYGDLDVSTVNEIPSGRGAVRTRIYRESQRSQVFLSLRKEIDQGRQAYIIYPLVEESQVLDLKDAVNMADHLQGQVFPDLRIGLLHGQLKFSEKEAIMEDFRKGFIHILVATTVVEVGLDIPNASVMVIENAERFGLAQLHQLRGRIGRGPHPSQCMLLAGKATRGDSLKRLQILVDHQDGFRIAEEDLKLRGPGEFLGTRQSGLPELRTANIIRDALWLSRARELALNIIKADPNLSEREHLELKKAVYRKWNDRLELSQIG